MIRHRLVRQRAVSVSSGSESTASMSSPPPLRRRKNSQDTKMFRRKSSESLDQLLKPSSAPPSSQEVSRSRSGGGGRRHSVACGVLYVDAHRPSIKSAFNSAVRRMSDACSLLSSAPSSTYNLSAPQPPPPRKENEVILPSVLRTYRPPPPRSQSGGFQVNRRFSTDCPPPSYSEATGGWKHSAPPKQKLLVRQNDVVTSKPTSLVAVEDDDVVGIREQN